MELVSVHDGIVGLVVLIVGIIAAIAAGPRPWDRSER
jgi:hypothetical protein